MKPSVLVLMMLCAVALAACDKAKPVANGFYTSDTASNSPVNSKIK